MRVIEPAMTPQTFSNAMVATVGAYAEVVAEQARVIEQLQAALRQQPKGPSPAPGSPAQAVIMAARMLVLHRQDTELNATPFVARMVADLAEALAAFDKATP